ncbi:MAG: hydroxyacylglutathione hydrolase [Deltaproteobacteria bacterium]|nr:hydroxyacylglutathione hydrolase [Deltaproteobacteria bacterium]
MLSVQQFRYSADNLGYLIYGRHQALAIDAGAPDDMFAFMRSRDIALTHVTNTHSHADHTTGNNTLQRLSGAEYRSPDTCANLGEIKLDDTPVRIYPTPGHTLDSVTFHVGDIIITGDTLFNGTVGNCFSGDLRAFHESINLLMALPDQTIVYAGHDYVAESMAFAREIEPDNAHIDAYLETVDPAHVRSNLAAERLVNPYVRFNDGAIIEILDKLGLSTQSEYDRWESMMSLG